MNDNSNQKKIPISDIVDALNSLLPKGGGSLDDLRETFEQVISDLGAPTAFEVFSHTMTVDPAPVIALNQDLKIVFSNGAAQQLFECNEHDLNGKALCAWIDEADVTLVRERFLRYHQRIAGAITNEPQSYAPAIFKVKGYRIPIQMTPVPAGHHIGVILNNVGERDTLKTVVDNIPCGVSVIDKDLQVIAWNEEVLRLQDYSRHLFEGRMPSFAEVVRDICERGDYGEVDTEKKVADMVALARKFEPHDIVRERSDGSVLAIKGAPIPGGGFVTTYTDITQKYRQDQEIQQLITKLEVAALHDPLTGLPNRAKLIQNFDLEVARLRRTEKDLSLLVLDLDHFKNINDSYGHVIGDHVLRETADLIRKGVRATDTPARFGGEEFAILLPDTDPDGATELANKIRILIAEHKIHLPDFEASIQLTGSFGTATMTPEELISFVEFINIADQGVYAAKAGGRNCVRTVAL